MKKILLAAALAAAGGTAHAQHIGECVDSWVANPAFIAEPWERNTRTWANGAIRLAVLDTMGEPAGSSVHLLVLSPNASAELATWVECRVISETDRLGWADMDIAGATADYDPARGLLVSVPVWSYVDGVNDRRELLRVRINQATGAVTLE